MSKRSAPHMSLEAMSRMNLRDMLVLPDTAGQVMADLTKFYEIDAAAQGAALEATSMQAIESAYGFSSQPEEDRKPFVYQDGVAVIPIHGTLLNRCNWSWGFVTGYQYIRRVLNAALEDDDVTLIVFDVDSPGGEAAGCFELAREIMMSRRVKPSLAMVDSVAASGGMALAAPATSIYAIPSARIGSIGVYRMHISYEDALKKEGIKVTFAQAGDHKTEGNPYKDLPDAVLKDWTESAGKTWDDFITLVAEARDLSEDAVRATQARVYRADEALDIGLINAVKTPTEAVAAFLAELAEADPSTEDDEELTMTDKTKEVTSGLTAADKADIARIAAEAAGTVVGSMLAANTRRDTIKEHAATKGPGAVALAKTIIANDAIDTDAAIAMIDAAFGKATVAAPKAPKGKGKQAVDGGEGGEGEEGDEDEGGEGDEGEGEEGDEGEEAARANRKGDNVNHFDAAMKKSGGGAGVGGGKVKGAGEGEGGKPQGNALLADHARVTGATWSKDAVKTAH